MYPYVYTSTMRYYPRQSNHTYIITLYQKDSHTSPASGKPRLSFGSASAGSKCTVCSKTVYKMEELLVEGKMWHISCFTCGGGKPDTPGMVDVIRTPKYIWCMCCA